MNRQWLLVDFYGFQTVGPILPESGKLSTHLFWLRLPLRTFSVWLVGQVKDAGVWNREDMVEVRQRAPGRERAPAPG